MLSCFTHVAVVCIEHLSLEHIAAAIFFETWYRIQTLHLCLAARILFVVSTPPCHTGIVDPSFSEYLATFIDEVGEAKADARLFLGRNLTLDQDLAAYPPSLLARCITRNGLECKIACASSKVSYVLDTEDLFVRARAARSVNAAAQEARAARFRAKVEALCSAVPAVEAEAPPALPVAEAAA